MLYAYETLLAEDDPARLAGLDALNLHHSDWTSGVVSLLHRFELRAFAWDVQEMRHLRGVLAMGIDGIYCDRVDRMLAAVGEWGGTAR